MPNAKREKKCYLCEEAGSENLGVLVCEKCSRPFCRLHGDPQMDECIRCLEGNEKT
jgi:hypothetical protein